MSHIREKFINEMKLRNYSNLTIEAYVSEVYRLARHFKKSPARITQREIREYFLYMIKERKLSAATISKVYHSLNAFYRLVLSRKNFLSDIPRPKASKKMQVILHPEEIRLILGATENMKYKALLTTIYSAGLRVSEALRLAVSDIDSKRMQIFIRAAKGDKDRYVSLSKNNLLFLREYYRRYRPNNLLFYAGSDRFKPLNRKMVWRLFKQLSKKAKIQKKVTVHSLRHSYATHLLENGSTLPEIQILLGHSSIRSTAKYLHLQRQKLSLIKNPFDEFEYYPSIKN